MMAIEGVIQRRARAFHLRHPRWKAARAAFLLAVIPFFFPAILPLLPAPAIQVLAGALLLVPLGAAIEAAMEYIMHRLYLFHRRVGADKHTSADDLETYAKTRSQFIGGFIHSFVGNLAFLVLTASVLVSAASAPADTRSELVGVVLSAIAGNLVVNILFVLGIATVVGGLRHKGIAYDKDIANAYIEVLTLAVIALGLPTLAYRLNLGVGFGGQVFHLGGNETAQVSDITAIGLLAVFVGYVLYTLVGLRASHLVEARAGTRPAGVDGRGAGGPPRADAEADTADTADTADAVPGRSPSGLLILLGALAGVVVAGAGIALISERMAGALETGLREGFLPGITLNPFFVGFILLPLASHISEVFAAISMSTHVEPGDPGGADRGEPQMETCQGLTIGSSIQVALLVAPVLVLIGHFAGVAEMTLVFSPFILAVFGLMVFLLQINLFDGKTDWLEGLEQTSFFVLLACIAFLATP